MKHRGPLVAVGGVKSSFALQGVKFDTTGVGVVVVLDVVANEHEIILSVWPAGQAG